MVQRGVGLDLKIDAFKLPITTCSQAVWRMVFRLLFFLLSKLRDFMLFLSGCSLTRADIDCHHCHFPLKAVHNVSSLRFEIDQVCV